MTKSSQPADARPDTPDVSERITVSELADELTYHDEVAVQRVFGFDIYDALVGISSGDFPVKFLRAAVFLERRHAGVEDKEAEEYAKAMKSGDVLNYFPESEGEEEVIEGEAETAEGKDGSAGA